MSLDLLDTESLRAVAALSSECYDWFEEYAIWRGLASLARVSRMFLGIERDALQLMQEQIHNVRLVHVRAFGHRPHWGLILHAQAELEHTLRSNDRQMLRVKAANDEVPRCVGPAGPHHMLLLQLQDEAKDCLDTLRHAFYNVSAGDRKIDGLLRAEVHVLILKMLLFLDRVDLRLQARDEATHLYSTNAPELLVAELQVEISMARPSGLTDLLRFAAVLLGGGALSYAISSFEMWWYCCADPDTWEVGADLVPEQEAGMLLHEKYERCLREDIRSAGGAATSMLLIHAMCLANVHEAHRALRLACLPAESLLHDTRVLPRVHDDVEPEDLARWADLCEADGRSHDAERILAVAHAIACPIEQLLCARRLRSEWRLLAARPADMEARLPLPEGPAERQLTLHNLRGWHAPAPPQPTNHIAAAPAWPISPHRQHGRSVRGRGGDGLIHRMGLVHLGLVSMDEALEEMRSPLEEMRRDGERSYGERSYSQLDLDYDMSPSGSGSCSCTVGCLTYTLLGAIGPSRRSKSPITPRRFVLGRNFCTVGCWAGDNDAEEDDECASCCECMPCATAPALGRLGAENGICKRVALGLSFVRKLWRSGGLAETLWEGHAVEVRVEGSWVIGRLVGGDIVDARACEPHQTTPAEMGCPFARARWKGREWPTLEIKLRPPSVGPDGARRKVVTDLGGVPFAWQLRKTKRCKEEQCACERYCHSWNVGETPRLQYQ